MGFKFRKSIKIAPGVKFNIGKKSAGLSIGNKFGGISVNSKTGIRGRASAPGTGLSYSTKLSGSKKNVKKSDNQDKSDSFAQIPQGTKKPIAARTWFLCLALLIIISGISYFSKSTITALFMVFIGGLMMFFWSKKRKQSKIDMLLFDRQKQIFNESIRIFMSTTNPETFFGRYEDAKIAAKAMSQMTDQPILHGEPPQAAVEMLERDKEEAINAFLDRFAKEIRMKAFELTRGRKSKIETFKLITGEYEENMTEKNIRHRDLLYDDMIKKISE